jgi:general secretion pathway protein D
MWQRLRSKFRVFATAGGIVTLASCASPLQLAGVGPGDALDSVRNTDLTAHYSTNIGGQAVLTGTPPKPQVFPGINLPQIFPGLGDKTISAGRSAAVGESDGREVTGSLPPQDNADDPGVEMNFDNMDVQTVAKTVVSDTLGLNVIVDPRVQGNVTIISSKPVPRNDLLATFENAIRMYNAAVVREGNLVRIVPLPEAAGSGKGSFAGGKVGFGVTVIPLRYTSAATVAKTAENFLSRPGAIRADPTRNVVMVQGTAAERQNAMEMIQSFDVEWMRNQSVGIYPLKSTSPDTMVRELGRVFETAKDGQGEGLISFQPIGRMNAVMAVAHNRKFLDQATQWIRRLDQSDSSGTTVRVYRLDHGSAFKIARILNDMFVGKSGGSASDSVAGQVAPGTNGVLSKLDAVGPSASNGGSNNSGNAAGSANGTANSSGSAKNVASFDDFADGLSEKDKKGANGDLTGDAAGGSGPPKGVFQSVHITPDTSNNSIVVYSNQEDYKVIERSIHELDRPQLQVEIEATIAEVTLTDALQYGVQYYLGSSQVGAGTNNGSISLSTSTATALLSQKLPGLNVLLGQQSSPSLVLSALSSLTSVKVLSAPTLVVADNQPAYLQVGDSVPISTGSATVLSSTNTIVNTVTMQDTGIILKVWPHIHGNGQVDLEIQQEVSNVVGGISSASANLNPTISERRIHSTVSITSGQTVLLGGLMSEEDDKTQTGIPILRQIQGLGDLFGTTNGSKNRTEIIIFVKPSVIQNAGDAQNVAEAFRAGMSTMHSNTSIISGRDVPEPKGVPLVIK